MANDIANNAKKQKFIDLLHELFQLNQPELDFGLYRIMHAKSGQIKAFIENDLAREIDEAFAAGGDDRVAELKAAYEQARAQAKEFGIDDPDANPKVKEAKEIYDAARENGDDPSDIYDHLYRFFSRYYDKGDFLSRRYHVAENDTRAAPYAVPYDGREVYLHWANKDQYYIKSSEYLSNFSFDLAEALKKERKRQGAAGQAGLDFEAEGSQPLKLTFQLVEAAEGAHNNVKENQNRFFVIHADNPIEVPPLPQGEGRGEGDTQELIINFEYRPDPEKTGQEGTWQKKRLEEAEAVILNALKQDDKAKTFLEALAFLAPTEKLKERTLLGKYLASYTARNTMDYFIHKDLGGFLRRELDFYIKNEIMRLDDLSADDVTGVTRSLKKITALRAIARQVIDFLAQLEEFQKKLWLKKKFVTEVNYCITLDRVPEEFYDEIAANDRQWAQWEELGFISEDTDRTKETLTANPYMMVDTGLFGDGFKARLLAEIEGLDEQCDGVLVNSENFQGLNLLCKKYEEKVDAIYIDPPYNTGGDGFPYKDSYKHSSWLSMIADRLGASKAFLNRTGACFVSIDENEHHSLMTVAENIFGNNLISDFIWATEGNFDNQAKIKNAHEYVLAYALDESEFKHPPVIDPASKKDSKLFRDEIVNTIVKNGPKNPISEIIFPEGFPASFEEGVIRSSDVVWPKYDSDVVVSDYKLTKPVVGRSGWSTKKQCEEFINNGMRPVFDTKGQETVFHLTQTGAVESVKQRSNTQSYVTSIIRGVGTIQSTSSMLESMNCLYDFYPKPTGLVSYLVSMTGAGEVLALDFFAGSGTTAHSVINLNREDGVRRKYVLVEMGDYFDSIIKRRVIKTVYAKEWKNNRPVSGENNHFSGLSHCVKYLRLESYEDTLNNLMLDGDERRADMLAQDGNARLRKDYLLHYFLDVETRGSASLLNVEQFRDPTAYTLMVKKPGSDAQVPVKVDLVETFNWLIGLEVALLDRPRIYAAEFEREKDPELPEDQHTRLKVTRFKEADDGAHWFHIVEGYVRRTPGSDADRERVMVVWRKLTGDPEQDAAALGALLEKYRVNQSDSEFDKIYINGSHGLTLSSQAKARLLNLEETFMARMWEGTEQGALH